jgi:hypothetical protein
VVWLDELRSRTMTAIDTNTTSMSAPTTDNYWSKLPSRSRNVGNQGLQFSAVGGWVYAQAVKTHAGREVPSEWFLQDVRD